MKLVFLAAHRGLCDRPRLCLPFTRLPVAEAVFDEIAHGAAQHRFASLDMFVDQRDTYTALTHHQTTRTRSGLNTCPPLPTGITVTVISTSSTARKRSGDRRATASAASGLPSGMPSNTRSFS